MKTIDASELKEKLDRGDEFKLVMTMETWAFNAKHIPGSLNFCSSEEAHNLLTPDDEIVVYCSHSACMSSQTAYQMLTKAGFNDVRRLSGGLDGWERAGYPLEGEMVD